MKLWREYETDDAEPVRGTVIDSDGDPWIRQADGLWQCYNSANGYAMLLPLTWAALVNSDEHAPVRSLVEPIKITPDLLAAFGSAWHAADETHKVINCGMHNRGDCDLHKPPGARRRAGLKAALESLEIEVAQ